MCSDLKSSVLKDNRRQKKNDKIGCQTKEENLRIPKMCEKSKVKVKIMKFTTCAVELCRAGV